MNNQNFDIIIIGTGIVGLTQALALAPTGLQIAIIDNSPVLTDLPASAYDLRVSAINRASQTIFTALAVWAEMEKSRVSRFQHMHVWDASGSGQIDFDSAEIGQPYLGHIIENNIMRSALLQRLKTEKNIQLFSPVHPQAVVIKLQTATLQLNDGKTLNAKLLIGADGANSWLREQTHISVRSWSYHQSALVTTVRTEKPHQLTAWQRFLPEGPLAFLPLADPHLCSIVWSTSPTHAEHLLTLDDAAFNQALTAAFANTLGKVEVMDKRLIFPLTMRHAKNYIKPRIALVGDAAHTIHPLAGQGVNLGLMDAVCLAEVISDAHEKQRDIASIYTLRRYERWRKGENLLMITAMEAFKKLFGHPSTAIITTRNLGLKITDRLGFIKNIFIKRAMGFNGDLPKIVKDNLRV